MEVEVTKPTVSRSNFITVLAWIFIVFAGFATFISLLQNIMINLMAPFNQMPTPSGPGSEQIPAFFRFIFNNMHLFFLGFLLISAATLVSAIGLLRRKNWARLVFIGILSIGILWNIGCLVLQQSMFSSTGFLPANTPVEFRAEFDHMAKVMLIFSIVMAFGFSTLFAWLIKRLISAPTRAEFIKAS